MMLVFFFLVSGFGPLLTTSMLAVVDRGLTLLVGVPKFSARLATILDV